MLSSYLAWCIMRSPCEWNQWGIVWYPLFYSLQDIPHAGVASVTQAWRMDTLHVLIHMDRECPCKLFWKLGTRVGNPLSLQLVSTDTAVARKLLLVECVVRIHCVNLWFAVLYLLLLLLYYCEPDSILTHLQKLQQHRSCTIQCGWLSAAARWTGFLEENCCSQDILRRPQPCWNLIHGPVTLLCMHNV